MNEYVKKAESAAQQLKLLQSSLASLQTDGVVEHKTPAHAAFEVYVCLAALVDIGGRYGLRLSDGGTVLRIPKGPANKANFPHFVAEREGEPLFQICLGTEYAASSAETGTHETYAPDLSVQVAQSPVNPTGEHVIFAWDAKHTANAKKRLREGEVLEVASKKNHKCPVTGPIRDDVFSEARHPHCDAVIINCGHSGLTDEALGRMDLVEVANYGSGSETCRGGLRGQRSRERLTDLLIRRGLDEVDEPISL